MLSKKAILKTGTAALLIILLGGCSKTWNDHYYTLDETTVKDKIVAELEKIPEISLFTAAVKENDSLTDLLIQNRLYTVFAPVDETFSQLDASITGDPDLMSRLIMYHFIDGKYKLKDLTTSTAVTFNNKYLPVTVSSGEVTIGEDASIISPDYLSLNGMIQVVDKPLVPKNNLYEYFKYSDDLGVLAEAIQSYTVKTFDIAASTPNGKNENDELTYDSVFIYTNPFLYTGSARLYQDFYHTYLRYRNIADEDLSFTAVMPSNYESAIANLQNSPFLNAPLASEDLAGPILANMIWEGSGSKDEIISYIEEYNDSPFVTDTNEMWLYFLDLLKYDYNAEVGLSNGLVHEVNSFEYDLNWLVQDACGLGDEDEEVYHANLLANLTKSENVDTVYLNSKNIQSVFYASADQEGYTAKYGEWVNFALEGDIYPVDYKILVKGRNNSSGVFKIEVDGQEIGDYNFSDAPSGDLDTKFDQIGIVSFNEAKKSVDLKFTFIGTHDGLFTGTQYLWIREIMLSPILE